MELVPYALAISFVYTVCNLIKQAQAGEFNGPLTQLVSWLAGVVIAFVLAASSFAETFMVGSGEDAVSLGSLNRWAVVLVGLGISSAAGALYDVIPKSTPSIGTTA